MNFHFACQSRPTLKSICFFLTLKTITKLNLEYSDKFEIKHENLAVAVHILETTQNAVVILRCCLAEDGREMHQVLQRTYKAIALLIKLFL